MSLSSQLQVHNVNLYKTVQMEAGEGTQTDEEDKSKLAFGKDTAIGTAQTVGI